MESDPNKNLIRPSFESTRTEEERAKDTKETFTVSINAEERDLLNKAKVLIQQEKDSTAVKTLFKYGLTKVLNDPAELYLIDTITNNLRKNKRLGIIKVE